MSQSAPLLEMKNIQKDFFGNQVLTDINLTLREGEVLGLVGENGAGKSTLIEAIAQGIPYTGSIRWKGRDLKTLKASDLAQRIGVLSQKNHVGYAYTVE